MIHDTPRMAPGLMVAPADVMPDILFCHDDPGLDQLDEVLVTADGDILARLPDPGAAAVLIATMSPDRTAEIRRLIGDRRTVLVARRTADGTMVGGIAPLVVQEPRT